MTAEVTPMRMSTENMADRVLRKITAGRSGLMVENVTVVWEDPGLSLTVNGCI